MTEATKTYPEKEYFERLHSKQLDLLRELDRVCRKHSINYMLGWGTLLGAVRHKDFIPWDDDIDICISWDNLQRLIDCREEFEAGYRLIIDEDYGNNCYCDFVPRLVLTDSRVHEEDERQKYYKGLRNHLQADFFILAPYPKGISGKLHSYYLILLYSMANAYRWPGERIRSYYSMKEKLFSYLTQPIGRMIGLKGIKNLLKKEITELARRETNLHFIVNGTVTGMYQLYPKKIFEERVPIFLGGVEFYAPKGYDAVLRIIYGDYMKLPPEEERVSSSVDPVAFCKYEGIE